MVNLIGLRKVKILYNFGLSECNRVNEPALLAGFTVTKLQLFGRKIDGWMKLRFTSISTVFMSYLDDAMIPNC